MPRFQSGESTAVPPNSHARSSKKETGKMDSSSFRFVVVGHPDQLKNRDEMRENRMHVMHDYLDKEKRKTDQSPPVPVSVRLKRSRKSSIPYQPATVSRPGRSVSHSSDSRSDQSQDGRRSGTHTTRHNSAKSRRTNPTIRQVYQPGDHGQPLVSGIGGRFAHSTYLATAVDQVPAGPGSSLEPFDAWPALIDSSLDVARLKWSCTQRFGSESLAVHWIPALLRARHAFLSTLCISSSHDAVMTRALVPSHAQASYKSITRWKIKRDVVSLVASSMNDPKMQASDETLIAVVQLLISDIMGCDDRDMRIHQGGLLKMVEQRGGLEYIGLEGQLAGVLTITNYLIAALREITPPPEYVRFASRHDTRIPDGNQFLPESPIYCRRNGFCNIQRSLQPQSETYELLETLRILTNRFYIENGHASPNILKPCLKAKSSERPDETLSTLCAKINSFEPAREKEFNDMNERHTYESIRLTAIIYAYALSNRVSFSKAAEALHARHGPSLLPAEGGHESNPSLPLQLKYALMRTDTSFCWDHLGGVLLWVAVIGGAAANPGPFADEERWGEAEDARKFLAAIAVRSCIVMSFQYGLAVLETLKRVVTMQAALSTSSSQDEVRTGHQPCPVSTTQTAEDGFYGPIELSHIERGFTDFAQDFLEA